MLNRAEHGRVGEESVGVGRKYPERGSLSRSLNLGQGRGPRWLLFGIQASAVQIHNRLPKGRGKPRPRQLLSEEPCMWLAPGFRVRGFRLDAVHCLLMPSFSLSSSPLSQTQLISLNTLFPILCHLLLPCDVAAPCPSSVCSSCHS